MGLHLAVLNIRKNITASNLLIIGIAFLLSFFMVSSFQKTEIEIKPGENFSDFDIFTITGTGSLYKKTDQGITIKKDNYFLNLKVSDNTRIFIDPKTERDDYIKSELEEHGCSGTILERIDDYSRYIVPINKLKKSDTIYFIVVYDQNLDDYYLKNITAKK